MITVTFVLSCSHTVAKWSSTNRIIIYLSHFFNRIQYAELASGMVQSVANCHVNCYLYGWIGWQFDGIGRDNRKDVKKIREGQARNEKRRKNKRKSKKGKQINCKVEQRTKEWKAKEMPKGKEREQFHRNHERSHRAGFMWIASVRVHSTYCRRIVMNLVTKCVCSRMTFKKEYLGLFPY